MIARREFLAGRGAITVFGFKASTRCGQRLRRGLRRSMACPPVLVTDPLSANAVDVGNFDH